MTRKEKIEYIKGETSLEKFSFDILSDEDINLLYDLTLTYVGCRDQYLDE